MLLVSLVVAGIWASFLLSGLHDSRAFLLWVGFGIPLIAALVAVAFVMSKYELRCSLTAEDKSDERVWLRGVHPDAAAAWEQAAPEPL